MVKRAAAAADRTAPTPMQALILWALIAHGGEAPQKDLKPALAKPDRDALAGLRLVAQRTGPRRAVLVEVTDRGWAWAAEHVAEPLAASAGAAPVLREVLIRLGAYLRSSGLALADVLGPQAAPQPDAAPPSTAELGSRIQAAYLAETGSQYGRRARLAALRARLADVPRDVLDGPPPADRALDPGGDLERAVQPRAAIVFGAVSAAVLLPPILQPQTACELIETRLALAYAAAGFVPPYPSWPFHAAAFVHAVHLSPCELLMRCSRHIQACLRQGEVRELASFEETAPVPTEATTASDPVVRRPNRSRIDTPGCVRPRHCRTRWTNRRWRGCCWRPCGAGWGRPTRPRRATWSWTLPGKACGCGSAARTRRRSGCARSCRPPPWRCSRACDRSWTASGIGPEQPSRHLVVVRSEPWPSGAKTASVVAELTACGGRKLMPDAADLRRFAALQLPQQERSPDLDVWLRARRPLDESPFLAACGLAAPIAAAPPEAPAPPVPVVRAATPAPVPLALNAVLPIGVRTADRQPVTHCRVRLGQDGAAAPAGRGSGAGRHPVDPAGQQQRPGADGGCVADAARRRHR